MKILIFTFLFTLSLQNNFAQLPEAAYRIAGEISTVDNQTYIGFITWDNNKMFWIDFFEASKINNPYAQYFKNTGINFKNTSNPSTPQIHTFCCRFGDIQRIRLTAYNQIELQIKDGHTINLKKGASNDIGSSVRILANGENIKIEWEKISEIRFKPVKTPEDVSLNNPITGIVKTQQGLYKGLITWERKERTVNNFIEGKNNTGNTAIEFKNINKISKEKNTFQIRLNNGYTSSIGERYNLNSLEQGVLVNMPLTGSVFIPWKNFEFMETLKPDELNLLSYEDFKIPQRLHGEVQTHSGEKVKGIIAYDLDESMDIEILDGRNDNISYRIPFKYIASIEPKNYKYSFITLRNGTSLSLGDSPDVSDTSSGIMVFTSGESSPVYIPWEEVKLITLE